MKKILIVSHTMELGGAERALLGLLNNIDYENYSVDLFLERHFGELLPFIPREVSLLPENPAYASLGVSLNQVIKNKRISVAAGRFIGKKKSEKFNRSAGDKGGVDVSINYSYKYTCPFMPMISQTEYDLVISFLTPHYFAAEKAKGRLKIAWIHTDYKAIKIDKESEEKMWKKFDKIISISKEVTNNFTDVFPDLKDRIIEVPNMHPASFIREESVKFTPDDEMPGGNIRFLSIGRYCVAKNFDNVPFICKELIEKYGVDLKWYIIGYGTDEALIRAGIEESGMQDRVILLGKKENPYPYIKQCDFYVQPSRFEGNAVTVNEALIIGKKVILTDYDTAKNQVENGVDGVIVPLDNSLCAKAIAEYLRDEEKQKKILDTVCGRDYSNSCAVNKIYELMR